MASRTIYQMLEEAVAAHGSRIALYQPSGKKGEFDQYSWIQYRDIVREVACGLRSLGVRKGEIVALHSETRAEFYLADIGAMATGAIAAALYTSLQPAENARTIQTLQPKVVIAENAKVMRALRDAGASADVPWVVLTGSADGAMTLAQLREQGRSALATDPKYFEAIAAEVTPSDHAILYMTSGATGEPKMGLVTHHSVVSNCDMGPLVIPLTHEDTTLAFLPSAHIAQRLVIELLVIRSGTPVHFSEGLTKMPNELRAIKPTFLLAPPRVWERVYASITTEIRKKPAIARKIFYAALGLGLKAARLRREGKPVPALMQRLLKVADGVVFAKIRERLGGRLRLPVSGSAPLSRELAEFYEGIGFPLMEGYGLTEGGVVTLNPLGKMRPGTIGTAFPGVDLKLAEDGELLIKSPTLFSGYYNDPQSTAQVLRDGWLYTGDLAQISDDGYVTITGRKKELIVSSNGKKIYPARIESLFKLEPIIGQILLIGDRQPYVTALIAINAAAIEGIKGMEDLKGKPLSDLAVAPPVVEEVSRAIKRVNQQLAGFEQIKRFRIIDREFSIDRGEMTPTMKVRRKQVLENYKDVVSELYLGKEEFA